MPIDRRMYKEDVVHICNGVLVSHKRNEIMPFAATWIDLEIIIQNEVSWKEKNKYCIFIYIYIYGIGKNDTDEPMCRA